MVPHLPLTMVTLIIVLVTPHTASSHEDEATVETTTDSLTFTHEWKG